MARVNVDQQAFTDSRFSVLATLAGFADAHHARGKMLLIWNDCQERETYTLSAEEIRALLGPEDSEIILVKSGLAKQRKDGRFYICGTRHRIEWLAKRRKDGRSGGRPRKTLGLTVGFDKKHPADNPPAPAPALTPERRDTPPAPLKGGVRSNGSPPPEGFEGWWTAYRKGVSPRPVRDKHKCVEFWKREHLEEHAEKLGNKLLVQIDYRQEAKRKGEFAPDLPDPIRYLKRRLWHEELTP